MSQVLGNTGLAYARIWRSVDARGKVVGKLASSIAVVLMGKHKAMFDRSTDCGDYVVVTNAVQAVMTGRKPTQKVYRHHTMYPGGLKTIPYEKMMADKPEEILRRAVSGMLPKNRLRKVRMSRLWVFPDEGHQYQQNLAKDYEQSQPVRVSIPIIQKKSIVLS